MKSRITFMIVASFIFLSALWVINPVTAITDGTMRKNLESNGFNERLIEAAIYPKSSHDVYSQQKRQYVHGINRVTKDMIYEPDVYTWKLAMGAHRGQVAAQNPPPPPAPELVQPIPMEPSIIPPVGPEQVQLTPLESGQPNRILMPDADAKMQALLTRARKSGIRSDGLLSGTSIKRKLLNHINSMNNPPSLPTLPSLPSGQRGDSCDPQY